MTILDLQAFCFGGATFCGFVFSYCIYKIIKG